MANNYDVVILGGGIGGYTAAVRAAQLGKSVAIVERNKLGGICLHKGCIPSKSLLRSAELFDTMKNSEQYGITTGEVLLNFQKVQERKTKIVDQLHKGVQFLMKKHKVDVFTGNGYLMGASIFSPKSGSVAVEQVDGELITLVPERLIIATGSRPHTLAGLKVDGNLVLTSDEALEMEQLPESIIIVGGGAIGVEWASMLNDFGVDVTIVEASQRLLPAEDEQISGELERLFRRRKINVITDAVVVPESFDSHSDGVSLNVHVGGEKVELSAARLLLSVGRQANTENIGLENTEVRVERGVIQVNQNMQTSVPHIYAIGDVIGGLQLAHVAAYEGITAVEHLSGIKVQPIPAHLAPRCVYTRPEIASVGLTESQAREQGIKVKVGTFNFRANGKALILGQSDGFVKVIADVKTDDIIGVHMIGPHVTDYISEAGLAQVLDATPWEVGNMIHPHPTLSETLGEAMLAVDGLSISM